MVFWFRSSGGSSRTRSEGSNSIPLKKHEQAGGSDVLKGAVCHGGGGDHIYIYIYIYTCKNVYSILCVYCILIAQLAWDQGFWGQVLCRWDKCLGRDVDVGSWQWGVEALGLGK